MVKEFVQRVLAWEVHRGQGVKVVHRAVRALGFACGGTGLHSLGQSFPLPGTSDVVPGQEGEDGVQPYQKVDWQEEDGLECKVCLDTHTVF